jgi:hypothetical protein
MSKGYTTRTEIENFLLITIDPTFYTQVDNWIIDIEKYIDQQTGRNFVADTVAVARYFDGDNSRELLIDDAVAITEIVVGDTTLIADTDPLDADGDFIFYPANELPITKITLRSLTFPSYPLRGIKVTGKWGYSVACPTDIRHAATVLVSGIITNAWTPEGIVQQESVGRYSVSYKLQGELINNQMLKERLDQVLKTLDSYKKYSF